MPVKTSPPGDWKQPRYSMDLHMYHKRKPSARPNNTQPSLSHVHLSCRECRMVRSRPQTSPSQHTLRPHDTGKHTRTCQGIEQQGQGAASPDTLNTVQISDNVGSAHVQLACRCRSLHSRQLPAHLVLRHSEILHCNLAAVSINSVKIRTVRIHAPWPQPSGACGVAAASYETAAAAPTTPRVRFAASQLAGEGKEGL
jgi:hypothetical protein